MPDPILHKRHLERLSRAKLSTLYQTLIAVAAVTALVVYFQSSFLKTLIGEKYIGIFFSISYGAILAALFFFPHLIKKIGARNTLLALLCGLLLSLIALATGPRFLQLPALVLYEMLISLIGVNLDIFIETFSKDASTGQIRGKAYTYLNVAWVLTPVISGWLASRLGFSSLFIFSAAIVVPAIFLISIKFKPETHTFNHQPPLSVMLRGIFKTHDISRIFFISFLLSFFYAWMIIYTPLHLRNLGFEPWEIGQIFSVMLLPFVLLQYPAGWLADKILGEKEILTIGLIILSLVTASLCFVNSATAWHWMLLLFATRIGASLIEIMRDTYFFKKIDFRDVHLTALFRNTIPLAYIVAPLLATLLLAFFPMNILFLFLGFITLTGLFASLTLKDTK